MIRGFSALVDCEREEEDSWPIFPVSSPSFHILKCTGEEPTSALASQFNFDSFTCYMIASSLRYPLDVRLACYVT